MDFFSDSFSEDGRDRRKSYLNAKGRVAQQQLSSGILALTSGIWELSDENPQHTSKVVDIASY
jgi:hypothetical protein